MSSPRCQFAHPHDELRQRANNKFLEKHVKQLRDGGTERGDRAGKFLNESKSLRRGNQVVPEETQKEQDAWLPSKLLSGSLHAGSQSGSGRGNEREQCVTQASDRRPPWRNFPTCNGVCHCGDSRVQEYSLSALRQAVQQNPRQAHRAGNWREPAAYQFEKASTLQARVTT